MEDKHNPGNGVVSNWTHENLRAQIDHTLYHTLEYKMLYKRIISTRQ